MTIYEILAQRFTEGTEKYNTLYAAIQAGINNGTLSDRDILKSPDSVINNLIRTIYSNKGDVVSGTILVNGVTYEGDGKRYAELGDGNTGGGSGTDTTALIDLLNNSINTTTNNLTGQIEGLRTETNNTFKDTINLSDMTSYHILKGDINFSNEVIATAFNSLSWVGNGTSQDVISDVDNSSQHGATVNEQAGGLILCGSANALDFMQFHNSISPRFSHSPALGQNSYNSWGEVRITNWNNNGFTVAAGSTNAIGVTIRGLNFGTTHRMSATDGSPELIVNGDFINGTASWINNGLLTMTASSGVLRTTDNNTTDGYIYQDIPTVIGKLYTCKVDFATLIGGTAQIGIGNTSSVWDSTYTTTVSFSTKGIVTFIASNTTTRIAIYSNQTTTAMDIDTVSVKENVNPSNHNKYWECHYNPTSLFTMVSFEGSGMQDHELPTGLSKMLDFVTIKSNTHNAGWRTQFRKLCSPNQFLYMDSNVGIATDAAVGIKWTYTDTSILIDKYDQVNALGYNYQMYGWASSYKDEANTLIGNFEIGHYNSSAGTDTILLNEDPGVLLIKRVDINGQDWVLVDKARLNGTVFTKLNVNNIESSFGGSLGTKKFNILGTDPVYGTQGGIYAYMVIYNNDTASPTKSKFKRQASVPSLNLSNVVAPVPNGISNRGLTPVAVTKNETVTSIPWTAGDNYLFANTTNGYVTSKIAPKFLFGVDTTVNLGDGIRDYEYDILKQKWIKVVTSDVNEKLKKDTLDFFGDGSCIATYRLDYSVMDLSGLYPMSTTTLKYDKKGKFGLACGLVEPTTILSLAANPIPFSSKVLTISSWINSPSTTGSLFGINSGFGRSGGQVSQSGNYWFRLTGGTIGIGKSQITDYLMLDMTNGRTGWNHYVTCFTADNKIKMYVNGVLEVNLAMDANIIAALNAYGSIIGHNEMGGASVDTFLWEHIRFFNRELTLLEVQKLGRPDSYTYQDALVSFLDVNVQASSTGKVTGIKKLPKTKYVDKLIVNELEVVKQYKPTKKAIYIETANRLANVGYWNTTSEDMVVTFTTINASAQYGLYGYIGDAGMVAANYDNAGTVAGGVRYGIEFTVPPGSRYWIDIVNANPIYSQWKEYRTIK